MMMSLNSCSTYAIRKNWPWSMRRARLISPWVNCAQRLGELPRNREIRVICRSGQRAYYATRILLQNGFKARNLAGGMMSRENLVEV